MSYPILKVAGLKYYELTPAYNHIERLKEKYSNKEIDISRTKLNYHLKKPEKNYKETIQDKVNKKEIIFHPVKHSNYVCEAIATSNNFFFKSIGEEETKRFFLEVYNFFKDYHNLREENIIGATIHNDETTPHIHLVFMPIVHIKENGKEKNILSYSKFFNGRDSYKNLQEDFYNYITSKGFNLEHCKNTFSRNMSIKLYKELTGYNEIKEELKNFKVDLAGSSSTKEELLVENKKLTEKLISYHTYFIKALNNYDKTIEIKTENEILKKNNYDLKLSNQRLTSYINKMIESLKEKYQIDPYDLDKTISR